MRLLDSLNVACPLSQAQQLSEETFLAHDGTYYMHDPRLETFHNTLDSPASEGLSTSVAYDGCPNVRSAPRHAIHALTSSSPPPSAP